MTHMHCYILNIKAVVFMASEKMLQVFIIISLCELKKHRGVANFESRTMIGRIYIWDNHYALQHTRYISCWSEKKIF